MITSSPAAFSQNASPFSPDDSFWAPPASVQWRAFSGIFRRCWNIRGVLRLKSGHLMLEMIRREMRWPLTFAPSSLSFYSPPSLAYNYYFACEIFKILKISKISSPLLSLQSFYCTLPILPCILLHEACSMHYLVTCTTCSMYVAFTSRILRMSKPTPEPKPSPPYGPGGACPSTFLPCSPGCACPSTFLLPFSSLSLSGWQHCTVPHVSPQMVGLMGSDNGAIYFH